MTDSIIIPTIVAAAACLLVVGITHALIWVAKKVIK